MKSQNVSFRLLRVPIGLLLILWIVLSGCDGTPTATEAPPATTAATVTASTAWDACEYDGNATAYGSVSSVEELSDLIACSAYNDILANGYVTTDATGQAKMVNNSCTLYVFQSGGVGVVSDAAVELCPEGTPCTVQGTGDCSQLTVVSLAGTTVTFQGTTATIMVDHANGVVLVIVSEGGATVTPGDGSAPFVLQANNAAYAVTTDAKEQALNLFGFESGAIVEMERVVPAIEALNFAPHIRRANLGLLRQGLQIIPIQMPLQTGFRWLNDKFDDPRISQAIAQFVDWKSHPGPVVTAGAFQFRTQGEFLDLKSYQQDQEAAVKLLQEAGMNSGREMVILVDDSIPGLSELAEQLNANLSTIAELKITLQKTNPDTVNKDTSQFDLENIPVLYLGGF